MALKAPCTSLEKAHERPFDALAGASRSAVGFVVFLRLDDGAAADASAVGNGVATIVAERECEAHLDGLFVVWCGWKCCYCCKMCVCVCVFVRRKEEVESDEST